MDKVCFLFDLNGTIVDDLDISYSCVCEVFLKLGKKKPSLRECRKLIGPDYWVIYKKHGFKSKDKKTVDRMFHSIFYSMRFRRLKLFKDALPVMQKLKEKGFLIGIVSNQSRKSLDKYIKKYGLKKFPDVSVGRDEVKRQKPSAQCLKLALEKIGVPPKNAFYIGDQTFDIQAAKSAGIFAVAVSRRGSYHTRKMLESCKPDIVVKKLQDVIALAKC